MKRDVERERVEKYEERCYGGKEDAVRYERDAKEEKSENKKGLEGRNKEGKQTEYIGKAKSEEK